MLQTNSGLQPLNAQTINGAHKSLGEMIDNAFGLLRRNFWIISATSLIGIATGFAYVMYAPSIYRANAQIIIDLPRLQIFQQQPVFRDGPLDFASLESQIQILQSKAIAISVVKNLDLANDPTFIEQSKGVMSWLFGLVPDRSSSLAPPSALERLENAVAAIEQNLKVTRVGTSYVIDIDFRSQSPIRAAQIANAVAEAFLADQMEARHQSMQRTAAWLQDRLTELRDQQRDATRSVADFKSKHHIVTTNGQPINQDALNILNGQLIAARTRTSELQAKLNRTEAIIRSNESATTPGAPNQTVSDTLTNPIITRLRDKYLEYAAREADYAAKYGSNHNAVINLRRQMRELQESIRDELRRIAESYKSDLEIAKQNQDSLEKAFKEAIIQSGMETRAEGPLHELQSSADAYRALYEGLSQRYVQLLQEQSSPTTEARLLTPASPPKSKSGPKAVLIGAVISLGGIMLGVGIGVLRQLTDRVFRTSDQVETALQVECISIIPFQKRAKKITSKSRVTGVAGPASIFSDREMMLDTIDDPFSRYAEAIRAVKFALESNYDPMTNKVIGVTSSLPNEGKSTIAGSLALLAADAGARTLLVDCDLRNPQLSRKLAPSVKFGLLNVTAGEKSIEEVILFDAATRLAFLPSGFSLKDQAHGIDRVHSNELLSCEALRKLFDQLREKYEYIVVDLSPIAPIVDVRSTTRFMDSYVLVVEWGITNIDLVAHALKQASGIYEKLIGVVLNKTPIACLGQYQGHLNEYYNSNSFHRYGNKPL